MLPTIHPLLIAVSAAAGAAGGALIQWALRVWWETRVRVASEKALTKFKHDLETSSAAASFDYSRRLQDFNLFIAKKHETIAQLHELLLEASSQIVRFARDHRPARAQLAGVNRDDAREYMENHASVPRGKVAEILDLWDTDRENALEVLYEYQDSMQGEYAERALEKAHNYRLSRDLYLPNDISTRSEHFLRRLRQLYRAATFGRGPAASDVYDEAGEIHKELGDLKTRMKEEMARSEL